MNAYAPKGKRTSTAAPRTRGPGGPPGHSTPDQPPAPPAPLDALRERLATLDALSDLAARTVEDAASENPVTRRRHARLIGMIAECAADAYEAALSLR